jgi:hypothetical protein
MIRKIKKEILKARRLSKNEMKEVCRKEMEKTGLGKIKRD